MPVRVIPAGVLTTPRFRTALAIGCAVWLVPIWAGSVAATTSLQNPVVTPNPAVVGSAVTFSVDYASVPPQPKDADAVEAQLVRASDQSTITIPLVRQGGSLRAATWTAASTVPAGTWQVAFHATDIEGGVTTVDGGVALVVSSPPATPTPTIASTPAATVAPTAVPTPPTPGATPVASPRPTAIPRPVPTPGRTALVSASPSPTTRAGPDSSATAPPGSNAASEAPGASAPSHGPTDEVEPSAAQMEGDTGGSIVPWLVLGGGMATTGATILVAQSIVVRRRRR